MTQKVTSLMTPPAFPSNDLLKSLAAIQVANSVVSKETAESRHPEGFRAEIESVILRTIRKTAMTADRLNQEPTIFSPDQTGFSFGFVTELTQELTEIVGTISGDEDDRIQHVLYRELTALGAREDVIGTIYVFAYRSGRHSVRIQVKLEFSGEAKVVNG
ncbi:MAG: hypothetical protein WCG73_02905 [Candidatus Moraniibacteriota bacterium]